MTQYTVSTYTELYICIDILHRYIFMYVIYKYMLYIYNMYIYICYIMLYIYILYTYIYITYSRYIWKEAVFVTIMEVLEHIR